MASQYEKRKAKEKKTEETVSLPLDREAVDILVDTANRKYKVVRVKYNLESGEAKVESIDHLADSQPVAVQKMNKEIAERIFRK